MLYANTDDGSSALWVLDDDGVVVDNISYSIADRATILEQINEHYGTSFTGWSDNEIGLRVGDTLPNWNAYEKIELPINRVGIRVNSDNAYFAFGILDNGVFTMNVSSGGGSWISDRMGQVLNSSGPPQSAASYIISQFAAYSVNVTEVQANVETFEIGQEVPDWDKYTLYG